MNFIEWKVSIGIVKIINFLNWLQWKGIRKVIRILTPS